MTENNTVIKKIMILILALMFIISFAFIGYHRFIAPKHLPKAALINTAHQPTLGNPQAQIHFVIFEDLKCSNCARFNTDIFPKIKEKYIDTKIATYTVINLAFIPGSLPAANAARCVYLQQHALFFPYIDYIFQNQPPENENWATVPNLLTIASKIPGINTDELASCLIQAPNNDFIENNLKIAIAVMDKKVATPALFINGVFVKPLTLNQIDYVVNHV